MTRNLSLKNKNIRLCTLILLVSFIGFFSSCSPQVIITADKNGPTQATFSASLSQTSEKLIRRFTGTEKGLLFNKDEISLSLALAGLSSHQIEFSTPTDLSISVVIPKTQTLLSKALLFSRTTNTLTVSLTPESVKDAIGVMPSETADFLELLMAPILTGEKLSESEYKEIIGATYGKTILKELENSVFTLTMRCPLKIKETNKPAAALVATTNNTAVFTIPLIVLLVMEQNISASAEW